MTVYFRLHYKDKELDLNDNVRYCLNADFAPPGAADVDRGFSFQLNLKGTTVTANERALSDLQNFLDLAGSEDNEDLWIFFKHSDVIDFEPKFGQFGRFRRFKIQAPLAANENTVTPSAAWSFGPNTPSSTLPFNIITLRLASDSEGHRSVVGQTKGASTLDFFGNGNNQDRGVIISDAETNLFQNPVFSHATWNNGFTASSSIIEQENNDAEFIIAGLSSAKLTQDRSGGTRKYIQTATAANTNTHIVSCYVKREDGAAVTTADCDLFYNVEVTTNFESIGDGWYFLWASTAGIAAGTDTGINVEAGRAIYVDGFNFCERATPTPLMHGDMVGHVWAGTKGASNTTRSVSTAIIDFDSAANVGGGTASIVWRADYDSTDQSGSPRIFDIASSLEVVYSTASTRWQFTDGTATITVDDAFVYGDIVIIHASWGENGLALYVDSGAAGATTGTYTPPTSLPGDLYLGTNTSSASHSGGTFMAFTIWGRELTAAQVLYNYTELLSVSTLQASIDPPTLLWTKDGDGVFDNDQSSGPASGDNNYGYLLGVGGDKPGGLDWLMTIPDSAEFWLGNTPLKPFDHRHPDEVYNAQTLITSAPGENASGNVLGKGLFDGQVNFFAMGDGDGATTADVAVHAYITNGGASELASTESMLIDLHTTTVRLYYFGSVDFARQDGIIDYVAEQIVFWAVDFTGTAASCLWDLCWVVPGQLVRIDATGVNIVTNDMALTHDNIAYTYTTSDITLRDMLPVDLGEVTAVPWHYNLITIMGGDASHGALAASVTTVKKLYLTPHYRIL